MNNKITNIVYNQNIIKDNQLLILIINYFNNYNLNIDIFKLNFYILTKYITNINHNNFLINIKIIYKLLGIHNIFFAKLYLFKKFIYNKDFIINFNKDINKHKYISNIYLTIDCYKRFCIYMNNKKSLELYENYINLEYLYNKFIEQKLKKNNNKLKKNNEKILNNEIKQNEEIIDKSIEQDNKIKMLCTNIDIDNNTIIYNMCNFCNLCRLLN